MNMEGEAVGSKIVIEIKQKLDLVQCEILPLWQNVKSLWPFLRVNLIFGKVLPLLWLNFGDNNAIFIVK